MSSTEPRPQNELLTTSAGTASQLKDWLAKTFCLFMHAYDVHINIYICIYIYICIHLCMSEIRRYEHVMCTSNLFHTFGYMEFLLGALKPLTLLC